MKAMEYLFREVQEKDISGIFKLVKDSRYHSDNLPENRALIATDVRRSVQDFRITRAGGCTKRPLYMFVLEDTNDRSIVGTSQIKNLPLRLGYELQETWLSKEWHVGNLALKKEEDVWELGGLLLSKGARGYGLGKLLSYGRMIYLASMNLTPRMLMSGFLVNAFWEYIAASIGVRKEYNTDSDWRSFKSLTKFMLLLPATRISLAKTGIVLSSTKDTIKNNAVPIQPESEPARRLLIHMGLTLLGEIEANGVLWYGAPWKNIKTRIERHEISPDCIQFDTCKASCHTDTGVAVLPSDDFRLRYVPMTKTTGKFVSISKNDFPCGRPKRLFAF